MYVPTFCRLIYGVVAVLKCNRGATPLSLRRFADIAYEKLDWNAYRCFSGTLLREVAETVTEVAVGSSDCCFPAAQVAAMKLRAPTCDGADEEGDGGGGDGQDDGGGYEENGGGGGESSREGRGGDTHTHTRTGAATRTHWSASSWTSSLRRR